MKLCQLCQMITTDEQNFCAHDGQPLAVDPLATTLQESVGAKYTISHLIGTGSMGAVYRAQHHALGDVAIKVMLGPPDNHKLSERFLREAKALRKLNNPHSVLVYDLERSKTGLTYMVMEMVEGRSLRDELTKRVHLSLEETIEIAESVCDALEAAHERGIIHRDLKPDNILLTEVKTSDGEVSRLVKIVDFGIVKLRGTKEGGEETSMQLTKYGSPIGTPFYMSPEQWFGDGDGITALDNRTDIYALGCTLYETLSGCPPFVGKTKQEMRALHLEAEPRALHEIAPHVPESISRVILRALEKDRELRPSSATEFAEELRRAFDESQESATDEEARKGLRAERESSASDEEPPSPEQIAQLQATEETVMVVRNWATEEAQQIIEQVREWPLVIPPAREQQTFSQPNVEAVSGQTSMQQSPADAEDMETTLVPDVETEDQQIYVPEAAQPDAPALRSVAAQEPAREGHELLLAQAGAWHIGLFSEEVESVAHWSAPVPLPHAPPAVLGVVSVRGKMLTLIDPAALLGVESAQMKKAMPAFIIVLRGDEQLALAVNRVDGHLGIYLGEIVALTESANAQIARGTIEGAHGQTIVLDARELFAAAMQGAERRRKR